MRAVHNPLTTARSPRRALRGTCPPPCGRADGSEMPIGPARPPSPGPRAGSLAAPRWCVCAHEPPGVVLEIAPHAVQMNRVRHHRVVHEHETHPLAVREPDRLGVGELHTVERPGEPLHVAGQVEFDGRPGFAAVRIGKLTCSDRRRSAHAGRCHEDRCQPPRAATSGWRPACPRADCRARSPDA